MPAGKRAGRQKKGRIARFRWQSLPGRGIELCEAHARDVSDVAAEANALRVLICAEWDVQVCIWLRVQCTLAAGLGRQANGRAAAACARSNAGG